MQSQQPFPRPLGTTLESTNGINEKCVKIIAIALRAPHLLPGLAPSAHGSAPARGPHFWPNAEYRLLQRASLHHCSAAAKSPRSRALIQDMPVLLLQLWITLIAPTHPPKRAYTSDHPSEERERPRNHAQAPKQTHFLSGQKATSLGLVNPL